MKKIRNMIKPISNFFWVSIYLYKIYFKILSFSYNLNIKFKKDFILMYKKNKHIKVKRTKNDLGLIGLVIRDFDNFFDSVVPDNNIIDFTVPKYHKLKTGHDFYFHDICEPLSVTDIYINKARLKG
jgi:hypothetical protein